MANTKLSIVRGNTLIVNFTNVDASNNPISLVGATVYFTVKSPPGWDTSVADTTALWQLTSTGNTGNTCTLTSSPAQTWVAPGNYDYDITIKYLDGTVVTPVMGTLEVTGTPTNAAS